MHPGPEKVVPVARAGSWADYLLLGLLVAVAAVPRLWGLAQESVWYDEFISIGQIVPGSLVETLRAQLQWDWFMVPLYHTLQYATYQISGGSVVAVRLFSVACGLASVAMLYVLGWRLFGRWAGFTAALLLALAPAHIYHSTSIRAYALVLLLALVSNYALLRMPASRGSGWWLLNIACNGLLLWTHLLVIMLLPFQGLFLLIFHRPRWRSILGWGGAHVVLVGTVVLWVASLSGGVGSPEMAPPSGGELAKRLFTHGPGPLIWMDYAIPRDAQPPELTPLARQLTEIRPEWRFLSARMIGEHALGWFSAGALILLGALFVPGLRRRAAHAGLDATPPRFRERAVFIVLWWILPVLGLFLLAHLRRQALFNDRFAIYALPAAYVAVGAALSALPWLAARMTLTLAVVGLMLVQTFTFTGLNVRHDYLGAARFIEAHAGEEDLIIGMKYYPYLLIRYNGGDALAAHEAVMLGEFEEVLARVAQELPQRPVWVVLASMPEMTGGPPDEEAMGQRFAEALDARGIRYVTARFLGMQNLYVFGCGVP
jgi:4-amino-4-deoxy-L-arabinose transferase-like glycosyltransferase